MDQLKPRAFISYAHEDQESALRLHRDLTRLGIDAWIDAERLLPGQNWKVAIDDAIRKTDFFIALLSDQSVSKRGYVQKELRTALDVLSLVPASEIFIIPLRLSECEVLEEKLKALHYVDLFPSWSEGLDKARRAIGFRSHRKAHSDNRQFVTTLISEMLGAQLEFAVGDGDVGLVDELLENGANPNHAVDTYGSLIIYACAEVEDDHVVYSLTKSLLEHGADVNAVDCHGATALFDATYLDKVEIAELLIKHGADVHHVDSDGDHALNHACRFHAIEGAKLLLRHGADVNSLDSEGQSPLLSTLQSLVFYEEPNKYGQSASQLANFLISEGANVKVVDVHGNDALFYAQENHVVLHANN